MTTTKHKPTDAELNRAAAEACGIDFTVLTEHTWRLNEEGEVDIFAFEEGTHNGPVCERCGEFYCHHCSNGPEREECSVRYFPNYCTDNDAAQELIQSLAIRNDGTAFDALRHLHLMLDPEQAQAGHSRDYLFLTAPPRAIVVACLMALGAYKEEWTEEILPTLGSLRGAAPNATGGVSSEDFIGELRSNWNQEETP